MRRITGWRTGRRQTRSLGYRRFFDVNSLIGLRMEREHVFDETHELVLYWLQRGVLDGVRIDHPDGLRDPRQYLERLRAKAPDAYIVAEKILESGEWMRPDWPVEGNERVRLFERVQRGAGGAGGAGAADGHLPRLYA